MDACVLVKAVPDASRRVDPVSGLLDRSGESGMNTADRYAVEAALRLREGGALGIDAVVAITMGPQSADRALRRALAMGCDQAVHLTDPLLSGSDAVATAYALACVLRDRRPRPRLVLLGERSSDGGGAVTAAMLGEFLGLPVITSARSLTADGEALRCEQINELGFSTLEVSGPAVISVATDANTPRYASLKETMQARSRPVQTIGCAGAGIEPERVGAAASAVVCGGWHEPPPRQAGVVITPSSDADAATQVLAWLRAEELI